MNGPELGRLIGSLIGVTGLFALSSAVANDFKPFLFYIGLLGIALVVIAAVVGGAWAGEKIHAFLTGRYFDLAFSKVAPQTEIYPIPQDPYSENARV